MAGDRALRTSPVKWVLQGIEGRDWGARKLVERSPKSLGVIELLIANHRNPT